MLCEAAIWLHEHTNQDLMVHNSVLEALLVHARLLDDFLGTPADKAFKDDVVADHFPTLSRWAPQRVLSSDLRSEINAHLAHLALRRTPDMVWQTNVITRDICQALVAFIDALEDPWQDELWDAEDYAKYFLSHLNDVIDRADPKDNVLYALHGT
jgi:hypothetical protein